MVLMSVLRTPLVMSFTERYRCCNQNFENIEVTIEFSLILDCYHLGKCKSKPRPILVKLQRVIDASSIFANRVQLSSPISIKPDISPAKLEIESTLLKERWSLIQAGHQHKSN